MTQNISHLFGLQNNIPSKQYINSKFSLFFPFLLHLAEIFVSTHLKLSKANLTTTGTTAGSDVAIVFYSAVNK